MALFDRRCKILLCWEKVGDRKLYGAELVQVTMEKVRTIRDHIKTTQDRKKKYVNVRRRCLEFSVGDQVFLKVAPWKNMLWLGLKGKLTPRFIRPFKILQWIGSVTYKVELPPQLAKVHDVFQVSLLRKVDMDPARILPQFPVEVKGDLKLELMPIRILDWEVKELRNRKIPIVRILWRTTQIKEETRERESKMRKKYPNLFELLGMDYETS